MFDGRTAQSMLFAVVKPDFGSIEPGNGGTIFPMQEPFKPPFDHTVFEFVFLRGELQFTVQPPFF